MVTIERQARIGGNMRIRCVTNRILILLVVLGITSVGSVRADDNVRMVQTKLQEGGFYFGQIDGAYSSELAAALTRYQIRNGLPITGQLDLETSKALGAKAAVTTKPADPAQASATWRRLREKDEKFLAQTNRRQSATVASRAPQSASEPTAASPPPATRSTEVHDQDEAVGQRASTSGNGSSAADGDLERLRDYVAAFVLAGLDPQVGAETDFFAEHVQYYDDGMRDREKIRADLRKYDARWPERRFWLAGDIRSERENGGRLRVTFPLRFELRNGEKHSSGKVDKTLVLEPAGDNWEIVSVNERSSR